MKHQKKAQHPHQHHQAHSSQDAPYTNSVIDKTRFEMLFDGIFAIAMTILILEVKIPEFHQAISAQALLQEIANIFPVLTSYAISFIVLGTFWYRHNKLYRHFRRLSTTMFVVQLFQVALAAFFPFCAGLMGHYFLNVTTYIFYIGSMMLYSWAQCLVWYLAKKHDALHEQVSDTEYRVLLRWSLSNAVREVVFFVLVLLAYKFVG